MNIVDIIIIAVIGLFGFFGYKTGFIKTVVVTVGLILVFVFSYLFKGPVAEFLTMNFPFFRFVGSFKGIAIINIIQTTNDNNSVTGQAIHNPTPSNKYDNVYKHITKITSDNTTRVASCPAGYTTSGNTCVKNATSVVNKTASCPAGYDKSGNTCSKTGTSSTSKTASCPSGQTIKSGKCYKDVTKTITETGTKKVTYYRFKVREYIKGSVDYKWSKSKNDSSLINQGYVLTGVTR